MIYVNDFIAVFVSLQLNNVNEIDCISKLKSLKCENWKEIRKRIVENLLGNLNCVNFSNLLMEKVQVLQSTPLNMCMAKILLPSIIPIWTATFNWQETRKDNLLFLAMNFRLYVILASLLTTLTLHVYIKVSFICSNLFSTDSRIDTKTLI